MAPPRRSPDPTPPPTPSSWVRPSTGSSRGPRSPRSTGSFDRGEGLASSGTAGTNPFRGWRSSGGRSIATGAGTPDSSDRGWQPGFDPASGFAPLESFRFRFEHEESVDQVVDRAVSVSFVALQPPEVRTRLAEQVRAFLSKLPETQGRGTIRFPYRTEVYLTHRVDRSGSGARASHEGR